MRNGNFVSVSTREFVQHMITYDQKTFCVSLRSKENVNCIIRHNQILCTYRYFNNEYIYKPYINVITRLRISPHSLHIELFRCRHVKRKEQFCQICKTYVIQHYRRQNILYLMYQRCHNVMSYYAYLRCKTCLKCKLG